MKALKKQLSLEEMKPAVNGEFFSAEQLLSQSAAELLRYSIELKAGRSEHIHTPSVDAALAAKNAIQTEKLSRRIYWLTVVIAGATIVQALAAVCSLFKKQ